MKIFCSLLFFTLINLNATIAQKTIDLATVKFTEKPDELLKGITVEKYSDDNDVMRYIITSPKVITYAGIPLETSGTVTAQHHVITSYIAKTSVTANTARLLKALIAKYNQPTKKLQDNGDTKAYYWQTSTLFIRFMAGESFGAHKEIHNFSIVQIVTLKALNGGAEPDLLRSYKLFFTNKV